MPVKTLLATHDSKDISEWMAFDMLKDKETAERLKEEISTPEDTAEQLLAFFKLKAPSNNQ